MEYQLDSDWPSAQAGPIRRTARRQTFLRNNFPIMDAIVVPIFVIWSAVVEASAIQIWNADCVGKALKNLSEYRKQRSFFAL